ncbi:hypothetical protein [Streptomyces anulatus]|uniref:hypothetical protein n=1 Tax=Streptomyces anulatus TaxID=1892 RepID=UPI00365511B7
MHGISDAEVARITEGQPDTSLQDFYAHTHPKLPTVERLISIGAFDQLKDSSTRRDLFAAGAQAHRRARTHRWARTYPGPCQIQLAAGLHAAGPSGLREMTARERLDAELGVLEIDVSPHLMEDHHRREPAVARR